MSWELLQHRRRDSSDGCRLDSSPLERSHTGQTQAGCCKQILGATRKAKNRRYPTTDDVERHGARLKTTSDPALLPVRAQVACTVCFFFSREVLPGPGRVRRKCAARLLSALPRTDEGARAGASFARTCYFQSVSMVAWKKKCAPRGASRKHRNALLLPVADSSAGQPHPPDGSKCSLTFPGQVSVPGAQANFGPLLLVGPHHASGGGVVNVLKSLTFG